MRYKGIDVIYEDNHLLIVNKPSGMLSQMDKTGDESIIELLKEYIREKYDKPGNVFLGSVHRLDRPTSGVMVFAKTSKALSRLTAALKAGKFDKRYYAILEGSVDERTGKLMHYLVKDRKRNIVTAYKHQVNNSKEAELEFSLVSVINKYSLMDIHLITGRSHQIRVQLSKEFFPIVGDKKYNSQLGYNNNFCLHCYELKLVHPVKKELMVFKHLPNFENCIWNLFKKNM